MLFTLAVASLAAAPPVTLYVDTVATEAKNAQAAHVWTQAIANELRRWGFRVTTADELTMLLTDEKQRQVLGCDDKDCGLDRNILEIADGRLQIRAPSADDGYLLSMSVVHVQNGPWDRKQAWATVAVTELVSDPVEATIAALPELTDAMRKSMPQVPVAPAAKASKEPQGSTAKRTCSATGQATFGAALALMVLFRRRRSGLTAAV